MRFSFFAPILVVSVVAACGDESSVPETSGSPSAAGVSGGPRSVGGGGASAGLGTAGAALGGASSGFGGVNASSGLSGKGGTSGNGSTSGGANSVGAGTGGAFGGAVSGLGGAVSSLGGASGSDGTGGRSSSGGVGVAGGASSGGTGTSGTGGTAGQSTAGAGEGPGGADAIPGPNFATVKFVFNEVPCYGSSCHNSPRNHLQVNKPDDELYTYMMSFRTLTCGALINKTNPSESALVKLLREPCGGTNRMPDTWCTDDGDPGCLPEEYIQAIEQWIENGAPR